MSNIRVAVLRGGPSSEYEVSLKTGESILKALPEEKYHAHDVFIDRSGVWHMRGSFVEPKTALERSDVVVNALHGEWGEDGKVQRLLDMFGIPYTGSKSLSSAIAMNKVLAKEQVKRAGIKTPRGTLLNVAHDIGKHIHELFRTLPLPAVIKPVDKGSSVGVTIAHDWFEFNEGLRKAFEVSPNILIEEYIKGKEATCGVIDHFRGEELYALLPVEIVPPKNAFYDYDSKYVSDETDYRIPGSFSREERVELMRLAKAVHQILGLRHYSRSDFIVSPRGIYFLEANTLPGMTSHSLIPKSLEAIGATLPQFLDHIVTLALERR